MSSTKQIEAKVYAVSADRKMSMADLLDYFAKRGSLRVSDLHLKVDVPPVYRVDGDLQRMKSPPLDAPTLVALSRSLLSDAEWADYLFMRRNPRGMHEELWNHSQGCRRWFGVERDTVTYKIAGSFELRPRGTGA